jgi:hypothetical protein
MQSLLAVPKVARMLAVKNFFMLNEIDQEFEEELKSNKKLSDSMDFDFSSSKENSLIKIASALRK